jgi:hypothetical protein
VELDSPPKVIIESAVLKRARKDPAIALQIGKLQQLLWHRTVNN